MVGRTRGPVFSSLGGLLVMGMAYSVLVLRRPCQSAFLLDWAWCGCVLTGSLVGETRALRVFHLREWDGASERWTGPRSTRSEKSQFCLVEEGQGRVREGFRAEVMSVRSVAGRVRFQAQELRPSQGGAGGRGR